MRTKKIDSEPGSASEKGKSKKSKSDRPSKRYQAMRPLSLFLRNAMSEAGFETVAAFARATGTVDQTWSNYLNGYRIPDLPQLIKLGRILNELLPDRNITSQTLLALLDPVEGDSMSVDEALRSFEPLPEPLELVQWYQELPFAERRAIAPILAHQIAADLELCSENKLTVLATLIQREMDALKIGPDTFAKRYEVPLDVLRQILQAKDPFEAPQAIEGLTLQDIRNLADNTRDPDKNLGNMPLFLELSGQPVDIRDFLGTFMTQHGLSSLADLVDFCLQSSGGGKGVDRDLLIRSTEQIFLKNDIPTNDDPVYSIVVSEVARQTGFVNVVDFLAAVKKATRFPVLPS